MSIWEECLNCDYYDLDDLHDWNSFLIIVYHPNHTNHSSRPFPG
jgi:hypothetical protein